MKQKSSKDLLILFSVIVIDLIGFGIVMPILPFYAEHYGASATVLGALLSAFAAMQFIFSPIWGKLSDKIGRKKTLALTALGTSFSLVLLGWADSIFWLFVARILAGSFAANISVATAYVTDVTDETNRTKGMGMIGAAFGVGFVLGPAIGGYFSRYGYATPIYIASVFSFINAFYVFLKLREVQHKHEDSEIELSELVEVPKDKSMRYLWMMNLLFALGTTQFEAVFAFFMMDRFGYDARHVATFLVMMAVISVLVQTGGMRRLATRFGEKKLILVGSGILTLTAIAIPQMRLVSMLILPLCLMSLGRGITYPPLYSLASKKTKIGQRGKSMGIFQSAASLARAFGPGLAGFLYDRAQTFPFIFASVMMAIFFTMSWRLPASNKTSDGPISA